MATTYRRKRTLSLTSLSSNHSKITLFNEKAGLSTITFYTRTQPECVYGSFTPVPSACTSLHRLRCSSLEPSSFDSKRFFTQPRRSSRNQMTDDDSMVSSGTSSPTIPSFSRTSSPPITPSFKHIHIPSAMRPRHNRTQSEGLHPILAKLEKKSKLLTKKVYCSTCNKPGADYPKCGRCDAMWCSRECRMYGGKRHICSSPASRARELK